MGRVFFLRWNHKQAKQLLLNDPIVQSEYDKFGPLYKIRRAMIEMRLAQGISQKELSLRLETRKSSISRLENGPHNPLVGFLSKVAQAMGKQVSISFK